ncbi:MAG: hypothetical protein Q7T80_04550 [Methanoregula sp.]|nr:hypothetical protein [Methanoregula sp.]
MRNRFITAISILIIFSLFVAGCVSEPGKVAKNETPPAPLPSKTLQVPPVSQVPPAPHQLYIKNGQREQFTFWGHPIAVNYVSAYPTQIVKISVDGSEKVIQKELTDSPNGIDWKEGNLIFTLKPVVWEMREGQNIPIYESTWNTSEVFFVVHVTLPSSEVTGGPKL